MDKLSILLSLALLLALAACGRYDAATAEKIVDRYEEKDRLSRDDYKTAVDLCITAGDQALARFKKIADDAHNLSNAELTDRIQEFEDDMLESFPHMNELVSILDRASREDMGPKQYDRYHDYQEKFGKELETAQQKIARKYEN